VYEQARPRFNVILSLLSGPAGKRGVDISTGFGFLPALLAAAGAEISGTEIDTGWLPSPPVEVFRLSPIASAIPRTSRRINRSTSWSSVKCWSTSSNRQCEWYRR
jgi:hypothetical protein